MIKQINFRGIYSPTLVEPQQRKIDLSTEYAVVYDTEPYWDLTKKRAVKKKKTMREVFSLVRRGLAWVSPAGISYPTNNELISACHIAMDLAEKKGTPIRFDEEGYSNHMSGSELIIEQDWVLVDIEDGSIYQKTDLESGEVYPMSHLQAIGVKVFERFCYYERRIRLLKYRINEAMFNYLDSQFLYSIDGRYASSKMVVEKLNHHTFKPALLRGRKDVMDILGVLKSEGQHNILYGGGGFYVEKRVKNGK